MLYGGWKSDGELVEKTPEGGGAMGDLLDVDLTDAMRIDRRGNFADRVFYQGDVFHHEYQWPYLHVNRETTMASFLSEGGFHTNPEQQMRNMNAEWKELEALSAFRSFLEWHKLERPETAIVAGYITDIESGLKLNNATVTIGDKTYTTDSYESLFNQYSTNPDQLRNGFYYLDSLTPNSTVTVQFSKENYQSQDVEITLNSDPAASTGDILNFLDVEMLSLEPPVVEDVQPTEEFEALIPGTPILVTFNRKMDLQSLEEGTSIEPEAYFTLEMADDYTLQINTDSLSYLENYSVTFDGDIVTNTLTGQFLDGDDDGEEGGNYTFSFTMSDEDTDPPLLLDYSPSDESTPVGLRPVLRFVYDEIIIEESITENPITLRPKGSDISVEGTVHHAIINEASVLHFFPAEDLDPMVVYEATVSSGLSDMFNNETEEFSFEFYTINRPVSTEEVIDDFENGISEWWSPGQAGQTVGYIPELTSSSFNSEFINHSVGSTGSMQLNYGWDPDFSGTPYIRQHLPPTAPQNNNRFNIDDVLQVYVFGDGSGNEFRMVIRDGLNQLETTNWMAVDWVGWRLVSWDLSNDPTVAWFGGDGVLDGANFYFDGFHLRKAEGSKNQGSIYFDHLHFVQKQPAEYPTTFYEDFQDYEDFTTQIFPWITVDVDGEVTYNPSGFTFPGAGEAYAWKVMNPAFTDPPISEEHPPVEGDKYLIAMMSQKTGENKWLISPQIRITKFANLSFWAKSIQVEPFGPERMKVYILQDDETEFEFSPENFTQISEGDFTEVPDEWTEYSYFLGEEYEDEVVRFAIQYVSEDDYMLMLDRFEVAEPEIYALTLQSEPEDGGALTGDGEYPALYNVPLSASSNTGYEFAHWADAEDQVLSTESDFTFIMPDSSVTLKGVFTLIDYELEVNITPEDGGIVDGTGIYHFSDSVVLEAIPAEGYRFVNYTDRNGDVLSTEPLYTYTMPASDVQLNVLFEPETGYETISKNVSVFPNPAQNRLFVQSSGNIISVTLKDITGKELTTKKVNTQSIELDVKNLANGFYLLEITEKNNKYMHKIQIVR